MLGAQIMVDILDAITTTTTGLLDGATIHLCKDDFVPDATTSIADLATHEADYTGYAASGAVTWQNPYIDPAGNAVVPAQGEQFQPSGTTTANVIYGWWLQKGTGGSAKLIKFETLADPVPLASPFDSLIVEPSYPIRQE